MHLALTLSLVPSAQRTPARPPHSWHRALPAPSQSRLATIKTLSGGLQIDFVDGEREHGEGLETTRGGLKTTGEGLETTRGGLEDYTGVGGYTGGLGGTPPK